MFIYYVGLHILITSLYHELRDNVNISTKKKF